MKFPIALLMLALNLSAFTATADTSISASRMSVLLAHVKVAPCLAKLYKLQEQGNLASDEYGYDVTTRSDGKTVTTIAYTLDAGDIMLGTASLQVFESQVTTGDPESPESTQVLGCLFNTSMNPPGAPRR